MGLKADAGSILKIAGDAGCCDDDSDAANTAELESRETPVVAMATTAKAAQVARMAWTWTSVVETPAAVVAMAAVAKTAEWARRPTPRPFWKSRETEATLARL